MPSQTAGALEEVEGARAAGERLHGRGREDLDGVDDAVDAAARAAVDAVGEPQRRRSRARRRTRRRRRRRRSTARSCANSAQHAVARLGQHREGLERLEGGGQPAAVALVVVPRRRRRRRRAARTASCAGLAVDGGASCDRRVPRAGVREDRSAGARDPLPLSAAEPAGLGLCHRQRWTPSALVAALAGIGAPSAASMRRSVSSRPEQRDALEDPGRDGRAGDRNPHRLEDLPRLPPARSTTAAQRRLDVSCVERLERRASASRAARERLDAAVGADRLARTPPGRRPARRRGTRPAARSRPASGSSRGRSRRRRAGPSRPVNASSRAVSSLDRQLAQVAAVHVAQLLLVEDRRRLRDALEPKRSRELVASGRTPRSASKPAPSSAM